MGVEIGARFKGVASSTGVVNMLPHPDYSMGKAGFTNWLGCGAYDKFSLSVRDLDGTVALEGCDGDPTVEDNWYTIVELNSDDHAQAVDQTAQFCRVNVTNLTSGEMTLFLTLES